MSLISLCLNRLTDHARRPFNRQAHHPAPVADMADVAEAAGLAPDGEPVTGCGWYESSLALRQGLAVTEWPDTEQAEGLQAWQAACWAGAPTAQACH